MSFEAGQIKGYLVMRAPEGARPFSEVEEKELDIWHAVPDVMGNAPTVCRIRPRSRWNDIGLIVTCPACIEGLTRLGFHNIDVKR